MTRHHDGDGCTGDNRPLEPDDHRDIAEWMGRMMLAVARRDGRGVLRAGGHIGQHYGPNGEWTLAVRLAIQITGLAPEDHRDSDGMPVLPDGFTGDDRVLLLATHCLSLFPETRVHDRHEVIQGLKDAVPLVEKFVAHQARDLKDECRAAWEEMYDMTACDTPVNRANTLRAGACTALLTCWAAHYSAISIDA